MATDPRELPLPSRDRRRYTVREIFRTLQGEGAQSGTPMLFVRFAGCNLWTGRQADRARDAERHGAACPLFCDTDFVSGERLTAEEIRTRLAALPGPRWICFTGGEPTLSLDAALLEATRAAGYRAALETNGTVSLDGPEGIRGLLDWVCVSPKVAPERLAVRSGDELKLVYRGQDPAELAAWAALDFTHLSLQPEWGPDYQRHLGAALALLPSQPRWRLSLQTHKLVGLP